ncbi:MAG TPA: DUF2891 domain-containing protein, partial [Mycobacterium sp.]|nr:DUF2891 domain-containing protein [Mycobacterium sp.]
MTTREQVAASFAELAVRNIGTEFPHATQHLVRGMDDPSRPRDLHPAFHGSYDWHSCVHMHWLLVRLLTDCPNAVHTDPITTAVDSSLTGPAIRTEAAYLLDNPWFERPYGWAWALALAAACATCPDPAARRWSAALEPLAEAVDELVPDWLAKAPYPVRHGVHGNTAFGLAVLLDAARTLGNERLAAHCAARAESWFGGDRDYPAAWEPSGQDFLSPALCEADLMRRVLPAAEFASWFAGFLPGLARTTFVPAEVLDPADGHQAHLYGLNLSRAWQMRAIADALPAGDEM